jgi:hypothetical protein
LHPRPEKHLYRIQRYGRHEWQTGAGCIFVAWMAALLITSIASSMAHFSLLGTAARVRGRVLFPAGRYDWSSDQKSKHEPGPPPIAALLLQAFDPIGH